MKISIVTPCYNQERFVGAALASVLDQEYPAVEYLVVDDGSTDGSGEVIRQYQAKLADLFTGSNRGFGEALNAGLQRCTGEIMAWINADDFYLPNAFATVARAFNDCPDMDWLAGFSLICTEAGQPVSLNYSTGFARKLFFSGRYLGGHPAWNGKWIPQESVFWRRSLWERAGGYFLRERLQYGDFELWSRFWSHADLHLLPVPLAAYRCHPATYTSQRGADSLPPCTRIIESAGRPRLSAAEIRWRNLACRISERFARYFGEPARALEYDMDAGRWRIVTRFVM